MLFLNHIADMQMKTTESSVGERLKNLAHAWYFFFWSMNFQTKTDYDLEDRSMHSL